MFRLLFMVLAIACFIGAPGPVLNMPGDPFNSPRLFLIITMLARVLMAL